jgi:zinc protease
MGRLFYSAERLDFRLPSKGIEMIKQVVLTVVLAAGQFFATTVGGLAAADYVTSFHLDNGMQVVVLEDHRAPVVNHMVWYKVGAADEQPGKSGIAHFLEHLLFKGTEKMAAGEFSDIIAANGGSENAFTSWDYTGYFQRIAADRLPLMMELEADRMRNLKLTEEEVLPERDVVIEERNSRTENSPGALFSEQRAALQYYNHRYGIPIIGWMHEIEQLNRADAVAFYETYYAPNNAILIVAGDVDPAEVRALANTYYGPIAPSENLPPRIRPQEPPHLSPVRTELRDARVRNLYIVRSYLAVNRKPGDQKEAAALTILSELLGGSGITSVLGRELQLEQKIAVNAGSFYNPTSLDPQTFGVFVVPTPDATLEQAEAALDASIARFLDEGPDAEHLERIKTQIRASEIFARDDTHSFARKYGAALTAGLSLDDIANWPDVLDAVTSDDVLSAARKVFNLNNSVTGWLRPAKQETTQ